MVIPQHTVDHELFGCDDTPGIVSVWADRRGNALVWRRIGEATHCERVRFRPWLVAAHLDDLRHLGAALGPLQPDGKPQPHVAYQELSGADDGYRFLISASDGGALERAVISGASQRFGRAIQRVAELDDEYCRFGPVEQYLISTGRVYFRGMVYADLRRMQFDLETTALDPQRGRIFMVAIRDSSGFSLTIDAPTPHDEAALIADLCALVRERDPDVIENHNLFGFDLPFLETRATELGVPLHFGRIPGPTGLDRYYDPRRRRNEQPRPRFSVAGRELIDTLDAVYRHDFVARDLPSHRLKDVARHFGVASPERTYIAGADVFATYVADPEQTRRYALDDVAEVDALSQRLMGAPFALAGMAPRRYERVASAGPAMGILEPILVRAYLHARTALPRHHHPPGMEPHSGGALHLFATGVARNVVKADIASLYPSLMRVYQIGPECDTLGVLLRIVDRLTSLRLHHKTAAREAESGSLEHGHHQGMQAAMKLIINAAYGYMGATDMAMFADRSAADEVTSRGRAVLGQVVDALRSRGMALIEADTDGVFFAVPGHWDEQEERALVGDIAAQLPHGIALEYEGRYAAMLSHEVKNYCLLSYSGDLVVRGVALKSSRAEPFGEQFLRQALRHTLTGDVAGLQRCYAEASAAIRERRVPVTALAARHRLSKTPEQYRARRVGHREAPYEALLAAGRTDWQVGERVRFYRAEGGGYVWLPDEATIAAPEQPPYHVPHYQEALVSSYASRLRKAFAPADFDQLFRVSQQIGLFDMPIADISPLWIVCEDVET